jgi:hypothetical protein
VENMIQEHFRKLWLIPKYTKAHMFVYIELSNQLETQNYANHLRATLWDRAEYLHIVNGYAKKPGQPGVLTQAADKIAWVRSLQKLFVTGTLHLARDFISNELGTIREEIYDQFERYAREEEILNDEQLAWKQAKITYGAKRTGKDDIATAIAGAIRQHKERIGTVEHINWAVSNGIDRL